MAEDIWNGVGNWYGDPEDWSDDAAPGPNDSVEIQSGDVTLTNPTSVSSLTVDSGATLQLSGAWIDYNNDEFFDAGETFVGGGGSFTVGGMLINTGLLTFGVPSLASSVQGTVGSLQNTGTITLQGAASGTAAQAALAACNS
jgi:hypothetical protein